MSPTLALALLPMAPPSSTVHQDAEQARVQADLHYNELKNSGALDDREFVRAMQLQIQRQNATGETA